MTKQTFYHACWYVVGGLATLAMVTGILEAIRLMLRILLN